LDQLILHHRIGLGFPYFGTDSGKGKGIIITNGFTKRVDKLPKSEKEKAIKYRIDYLSRFEED
jgi:hypothetical protein